MIKITVYEALGSFHVTIDSIPVGADFVGPTRPTSRSLHYSCHSASEIPNCETLARVVRDALDHADGYAGDVMEHCSS